MRYPHRRLFFIFIVLFTLFHAFSQILQPPKAKAQISSEYFETNLHTTVTVNSGGQSRVKHEFEITNKTPTTFVSQYGLKISSSELKNITVTSNGEPLDAEINHLTNGKQSGPGQTSIGITFPDKVVGEGKSRSFTISYTHPDAAVISGSVLEVTLPPQANPEDYAKYTVTLITPAQYGGPVRTTPDHHTYTSQGNEIITSFEQNGANGIFALFGSQQLFDLDLQYHLINDTNNLGITQIALPPDTSYQRLYYHKLEPRPQEIEYDLDGNWIATYELPAGSRTLVQLTATAELSLEPNSKVPIPNPSDELLQPQTYWPVTNSDIQELANEYSTAAAINEFVVQTLSYNTQRALNNPERFGAVEALNHPDQAVCQEFTDVFITMARAADIPARRMTGYAYTQNSDLRPLSLVDDILHAWPEYFDREQKRWIPIDPTWENTTGGVDYFNQLDLSHIVFAINGHNSVTPYPAGSYKSAETTEKTVNVTFGTQFPEPAVVAELTTEQQRLLGVAIPGRYTLKITNTTGWAAYNTPITIKADHSQLVGKQYTGMIPTLLPYQTLEIPLRLQTTTGFLPQRDTITVELGTNQSNSAISSSQFYAKQQFELTSGPRLSDSLQRPHLLLAVAAILIGGTLLAGSVLVLKRRR